MCRAIQPLFNFEPAATEADVRAAALQYVRKISGYTHPSRANEAAFQAAVDAITAASLTLLASLKTPAPPRSREITIERARSRAAARYANQSKGTTQ